MKHNPTPTLLIDKQKCLRNISRMADKARRHNLVFRPHFKTHYSAEVGEWFRDFGVEKITVSSVDMATYFQEHGWNDILIAFPCNIPEMDKINSLAERCALGLTIMDSRVADFLANNLSSEVNVVIKIDTGYHRTGLEPGEQDKIDAVLAVVSASEKMNFTGFISHAGHTYKAESKKEIEKIHLRELEIMQSLQKTYSGKFGELTYSIGDTPSCSTQEYFEGVNEIRPGNFVFYDLMQQALGACDYEDIAVAVECPVVAVHENRSEVIIYGGAVHFSKDFIRTNDGIIYGRLVTAKEGGGWMDVPQVNFLSGLSQEHGIVKMADREYLKRVKPGDTVLVLPVHSCLTVDGMGERRETIEHRQRTRQTGENM